MVETSSWMITETVEVVGHAPHASVDLFEYGSLDAIAFRPIGGDVFCYIIELRMTDNRRIFIRNLRIESGEEGEILLWGSDRRIDSVVFSCNPRFGVTGMELEVLVR